MCCTKPGPRCSSHARNRYKSAEAEYFQSRMDLRASEDAFVVNIRNAADSLSIALSSVSLEEIIKHKDDVVDGSIDLGDLWSVENGLRYVSSSINQRYIDDIADNYDTLMSDFSRNYVTHDLILAETAATELLKERSDLVGVYHSYISDDDVAKSVLVNQEKAKIDALSRLRVARWLSLTTNSEQQIENELKLVEINKLVKEDPSSGNLKKQKEISDAVKLGRDSDYAIYNSRVNIVNDLSKEDKIVKFLRHSELAMSRKNAYRENVSFMKFAERKYKDARYEWFCTPEGLRHLKQRTKTQEDAELYVLAKTIRNIQKQAKSDYKKFGRTKAVSNASDSLKKYEYLLNKKDDRQSIMYETYTRFFDYNNL